MFTRAQPKNKFKNALCCHYRVMVLDAICDHSWVSLFVTYECEWANVCLCMSVLCKKFLWVSMYYSLGWQSLKMKWSWKYISNVTVYLYLLPLKKYLKLILTKYNRSLLAITKYRRYEWKVIILCKSKHLKPVFWSSIVTLFLDEKHEMKKSIFYQFNFT